MVLPGILLPPTQVVLCLNITTSLTALQVNLASSVAHISATLEDDIGRTADPWRINPLNCLSPGGSRSLPPGVGTFSPGWQAQGHYVSPSCSLRVSVVYCSTRGKITH